SHYDRVTNRFGIDRHIIASIYNRIGIDVAGINILHVRLDDQNRYESNIDSFLNRCLTVEANIDQAATAFRQDIAMTILENGHAVVVPVETTLNPNVTGGYDIKSLRVGKVLQWYPKHVRVDLYDERDG